MKPGILYDTDILIDYLRDEKSAVTLLEGENREMFVSAVTVAELYAGAADALMRAGVRDLLLAFATIEMSQEIAISAGNLRSKYGKSHGTGLADAIVAATALSRQCPLVTGNKKHYPMIRNIIYYRRKR